MIFNYIEEKSLKILNEFDLLKYPINVNKLAKKLGVGVEAAMIDDTVTMVVRVVISSIMSITTVLLNPALGSSELQC